MESRIARLESDVAHIRTDVADMKTDIRDLRNKMEAGFTELRQSIAQLHVALERVAGKSTVTSLETRVWGLTMLGGVLFAVARAEVDLKETAGAEGCSIDDWAGPTCR